MKSKIELIIGVLGILIGIYLYADSLSSRELVIDTTAPPTLIADSSQTLNTGIKVIRSDGAELNGKVWVQPIVIWNPGKLAIRQEHILTPIVLALEDNTAELLNYRISQQVRPDISKASLVSDVKDSFRLTFNILENKDAIYAQITYLAENPAKLKFMGEIEGIENILEKPPKNWTSLPFNIAKVIFFIVLGFGALFIFVTSLERVSKILKPLLPESFPKIFEYVFLFILLALIAIGVVSGAMDFSNPKPPVAKELLK